MSARDAPCAGYLEKARWSDGFVCPHCQAAGEPFRFANRHGVLRCRKCRRDTGLTVGTVMARSHTPLSVWFWSAYLVSSQTPGVSAVQLRRQLGLSRYETAFQILHKLRAGMVRPDQDRIGGRPGEHVEVDETWVHLVFANLKTWLNGIHHGVITSTCKPTSTNSPSASTGGSIRSTPSVPCSASRATSPHRPTQSFTPEPGSTLHVGGVGNNRIGKQQTKATGKPPEPLCGKSVTGGRGARARKSSSPLLTKARHPSA